MGYESRGRLLIPTGYEPLRGHLASLRLCASEARSEDGGVAFFGAHQRLFSPAADALGQAGRAAVHATNASAPFHSDNGSEYINKRVAALLHKMLIEEQTRTDASTNATLTN
jgi:hypothetical protein